MKLLSIEPIKGKGGTFSKFVFKHKIRGKVSEFSINAESEKSAFEKSWKFVSDAYKTVQQ